jgi:hypothetical protein
VGIVPKVAVSYAGTWVIGRTIYLWATEGEKLNREEVRRFYEEAIARGRTLAETLMDKVREATPLLPSPNGERADASLATEPERKPGLWQRVRRRLPFRAR